MYHAMKQARGFSMLEVLIAMLVIMIGALGIASMQLLAVTSTENARYQNVATMLGSSLAGAMQANVNFWGTPPPSITVIGTTNVGGPAATSATCEGPTNVCTGVVMASRDLRVWGKEVADSLPGGRAVIVCPALSSPAICTITVSWTQRNVSLSNATTDGSANGNSSYQTLVSIL
jgi:type IV pilus assembly protein PilV